MITDYEKTQRGMFCLAVLSANSFLNIVKIDQALDLFRGLYPHHRKLDE